ncbi:hypothetical protein QE374_001483 [Microbacterium sp. SORGH_AS428]|uniref:hypothetical protein n=1 Tax=Microbacterium sp. SORGH_AS_0428 TaxID=3041788 RepID=UPI0028671B30|nr:hypothetical protein [Microbacterium sp. SORGH_AS_0428]MDR6199574.1 hypothetical protein [Microbacterium sp. SORGH_AS_0428]
MTTPADTEERRRIAIVDGASRHDLLIPPAASIADALASLGIRQEVGRDVLLEVDGREVSPLLRVDDLSDGTVLALVDLSQKVKQDRRRRRDPSRGEAPGAWWVLGGIALVLAVFSLIAPDAVRESLRFPLAVAMGAFAVTAGMALAVRATGVANGTDAALVAVLTLAFAAGAGIVPAFPAATSTLQVFVGLLSAAVLAGMLALVGRPAGLHARLSAATTLLLVLAGVWGFSLILSLPVSAPTAVTLGLAPVALRILLATLVDVPPGIFIDYERYQTTRWSVRQQLPEEIHSIGAADARDLVARSTGRLVAGTFVLTVAVALSAPFALPDMDDFDPLVLSGRIALAITVVLALLLGARRFSVPLLRWLPRLAAGAVAVVMVLTATREANPVLLTVLASILLAVGAVAALVIIPTSRGAQSLRWSRFGDVIEWIAIALSLPAGLLAADTVDILRGMMGA